MEKTYRIAIVEDDKEFRDELEKYLIDYGKENKLKFHILQFEDGADIVASYKNEYDIILLDIEMPKLNGMEAAGIIREKDENVVLMFITNMAQYAIHGYSVGALDFVMKPITYYTFSLKMTRALKRVQTREPKFIVLNVAEGIKTLPVKDIFYVEVENRMLHYHTEDGVIITRGSLQSAEETLEQYPFAKCNQSYLVNLMHVKEVKKNMVLVGKYTLEISRRHKTAFLKALTEYMGGNF